MCAGHGFTGHYDEYFGLNTDTESFNYLQLANWMLKSLYPDFIITISEVKLTHCCSLHAAFTCPLRNGGGIALSFTKSGHGFLSCIFDDICTCAYTCAQVRRQKPVCT